ncbi:MAG: hypothetical protein ACI38U_16400 [Corynebacterium sp.]|jgi:hypothetical protein|uniref:hypothetical protein n=1 Tax=unclassified Corynebacterium TaxID=2624378 RepID=UPI00096441E9|nr:hypothetical protein [Corynebacterium sp. CNJ-954]OLT53882.1 hypothetical protein BJF89_03690 [Corynebacterium sp. CNJ-954]
MSSESIPPQLRGIVSTYIDATTTAAPTAQDAALTLDDDAHLIAAHVSGEWDDDDREHRTRAHQTIVTMLDTASSEDLAAVRDELSAAAEHLVKHSRVQRAARRP